MRSPLIVRVDPNLAYAERDRPRVLLGVGFDGVAGSAFCRARAEEQYALSKTDARTQVGTSWTRTPGYSRSGVISGGARFSSWADGDKEMKPTRERAVDFSTIAAGEDRQANVFLDSL